MARERTKSRFARLNGIRPAQRFGLLVFGALLVVLFVGFAIVQGIGNPSVPSGAVAIIEDAPSDLGTVTEAQFKHQLPQAAAAAQIKPVPKPGDEKYDELKETALGELFDAVWLQGQAEAMGIEVTDEEIAEELKKLKSQAFKTEKQYKEFLEEAHYTQADVNQRVKIQMLSTQIQEQVREEEGEVVPSKEEIQDYYDAAKASQYTQEEKREARALIFKNKAEAEKAKAELEEDDSVKSWEKLGTKSVDPADKKTGGLVNDSAKAEGIAPEPLHAALFAGTQGQVEGPLHTNTGYEVYEVLNITPESVQSLDEAKPQISTRLAEQSTQRVFTEFVGNYEGLWKSRTFCASGFVIERCANYKGTGHPAEANPACYEANPKTPVEICPAPVEQVKPAEPGTINALTLEGRKLPQHPRPAGEVPSPTVPTEELGAPPTG